MILDEIRGFEQKKPHEDKKDNSKKKYYFRKQMLELNSITRMLESKKEEAVWKEEYELANEIEKCLTKLKTSEVPLKELITKRIDALEENDYLEAQRLKNKFEVKMEDALQLPELEKFLTPKEIERLRLQRKVQK